MSNVLIIGDPHEPFCHRNYLEFCHETKKKYKCKFTVHIGDGVDNHAISYHEHSPDGYSPADEMKAADKKLKVWFKAFPSVHYCRGNHDRLVSRKSKTVGIPERAFKPFREIWNLPSKWIDAFDFEIDDVLYKHGTGYGGKTPHLMAAQAARMNTVIGHAHTVAGVEYDASERDCIFGMSVGCGIDRHTYAFDYGRDFKKKPILSCGVVFDGESAQVVRMKL